MSGNNHHDCCDWQLDQYNWECTCGVTRPKHPDFDAIVEAGRTVRRAPENPGPPFDPRKLEPTKMESETFTNAVTRIEAAAAAFRAELEAIFPGQTSRELSLAKTNLDQARHWALDYARQPAPRKPA